MATQMHSRDYIKAIQAKLVEVFTGTPVYALMNRNWALEPKFVTWQMRNVHQPVYTGVHQMVKGIDRPTFQISIFATSANDALVLADTALDQLHGFTGMFSDIYVTKTDVMWLYNSYDDKINLYQVFLDVTIDIQT